MITSLTQDQIDKFPDYVKKWTEIGLSTEPANRPAAEIAIHKCYELAGLKPPKLIIWSGSPLAQAILYAILTDDKFQTLMKNTIGENVGDKVRDKVRDNVWDNVWDNAWDNVADNVGASVRENVWDNVRENVVGNVRANVWDQVAVNVKDNVADQVFKNVADQVFKNVGENVGRIVLDQASEMKILHENREKNE